jgi:hypothetical protein
MSEHQVTMARHSYIIEHQQTYASTAGTVQTLHAMHQNPAATHQNAPGLLQHAQQRLAASGLVHIRPRGLAQLLNIAW